MIDLAELVFGIPEPVPVKSVAGLHFIIDVNQKEKSGR